MEKMTRNTEMSKVQRWRLLAGALATSSALLACGGGSGGGASAPPTTSGTVPVEAGAPASVGNIAVDGLNWINYRRGQIGMPALARNTVVDTAAQAHSAYQKANNIVSHDEVQGKTGFTGVHLLDRLNAAGYFFANSSYAYGEVISASTSSSGFFMSEELITAIYHRFIIFEPKFKEVGTGSASTSAGYTYFTSDFTANNGYGPGIGRGQIVSWPANGQKNVTPNFFSDYESPDPVAGVNEVGYPVSVHADINVVLAVQSFTIRPQGGSALPVKLLAHVSDQETPQSAAAIVPMAVLKANTTYEVSFAGTADGAAITRNWSFTTK
jgi:uncharacterized protein YkwD